MKRFFLILLVAIFSFGVMPVHADPVRTYPYILPLTGKFHVTQEPHGTFSHNDPNSTIEAWDLGSEPIGPLPVPVAVAEGKVIFAGWQNPYDKKEGYGLYIKILHPSGLTSLYAHLAYASVSVGQDVSQGQQIGVIDSTGNSTGTHLHFSLFKNNKPYPTNDWIDFSGLRRGIIDRTFDIIFPKMGGAAEPLKPIDFKPIGDMVAKFYNWALDIGSMVALGIIIFGGVLYISAAGSDSKLKESKEWIKAAIYGLILLLLSYLLLHTINPCLVGAGSGCT